ncbi:hypothetical protein JXA12_02485 [Candidatus Woesearchaeota archaeon]|nr:hypothetical protein [Candidatus Woesearchaeota archaeon]
MNKKGFLEAITDDLLTLLLVVIAVLIVIAVKGDNTSTVKDEYHDNSYDLWANELVINLVDTRVQLPGNQQTILFEEIYQEAPPDTHPRLWDCITTYINRRATGQWHILIDYDLSSQNPDSEYSFHQGTGLSKGDELATIYLPSKKGPIKMTWSEFSGVPPKPRTNEVYAK